MNDEQQIADAMVELVLQVCPDAALVPKYGGLMIEAVAGDSASHIGGYFFYAAHMSLEFSKGATFDDPNGVLEGGGQHRRHIKVRSLEDLESKHCREMLAQALALFDTR